MGRPAQNTVHIVSIRPAVKQEKNYVRPLLHTPVFVVRARWVSIKIPQDKSHANLVLPRRPGRPQVVDEIRI